MEQIRVSPDSVVLGMKKFAVRYWFYDWLSEDGRQNEPSICLILSRTLAWVRITQKLLSEKFTKQENKVLLKVEIDMKSSRLTQFLGRFKKP